MCYIFFMLADTIIRWSDIYGLIQKENLILCSNEGQWKDREKFMQWGYCTNIVLPCK